MSNEPNPYRAAGTFSGPSYLERKADRDLLRAIHQHQRYPYVLAPRQSGKSSLIDHVRGQLSRPEFHTAFVDFSIFSEADKANLDALYLRLFEYCRRSLALPHQIPVVTEFIDGVEFILDCFPDARLVIFLDEIDALLSSPVKDTFFSVIRNVFNSQSSLKASKRAQFVLCGAARPEELIADRLKSPFNVGTPIILRDFSPQETAEICRFAAERLSSDREGLASEVYRHAHGSVYLTQLILESLWEMESIIEPTARPSRTLNANIRAVVERIVADAASNVHFLNIRDVLQESPRALGAFRRLVQGGRVSKDERELLSFVGLSQNDGTAVYRNQIYEQVFQAGGILDQVTTVATPAEFDVFISYSSKDRAWVRGELLQRIEQAGLTALIDFRDFALGASSITEMERGVKNCRKTLLILTPDYVSSEWSDFELVAAHTLSSPNRDLRLIPLLKAPCEIPRFVGAVTHIDFTEDADKDLAWQQLLTALGKPPEPSRDHWFLAHPYPIPPNFTGRVAERAMLDRWLGADAAYPLLSLLALGGFGKSALVWYWLTHDVPPADWPRVVWWSFYDGDVSFDHFLAESLDYLSGGKIDGTEISGKEALKALLDALHAPGTLLVLDGFERMLRGFGGLDAAYQGDEAKHEDHDRDCISPLAEKFLYNVALQPQLRSKVLLTTRLCPRVLEAKGGGLLAGCREEELSQMQPADAAAFFLAQGIRGTHTEIETACEPYGYHPLSLRLLAGLIVRDVLQPGDIAAAKRLDVSGDLIQRQHHMLEASYESLAPSRRALLGRIACFRSPVSYETLKALAEDGEEGRGDAESGGRGEAEPRPVSPPRRPRVAATELDADLRDLVVRGLVHHDTREGRFDLHPIVRRYAYDRLAGPDRAAAHTRLRDYFAAVPAPDKVTRLEDLAPVIELYHHTVRAGQLDEAFTFFRDRLAEPLYYQLGAHQLEIDLLLALFPDGEDRPPRLNAERDRAWTLSALANSYSLSGQPRRAVPLFEQHNAIYERQGNKSNLATGLANAAMLQLVIGALRAAEANLRRSVVLCQEIADEFGESAWHQALGRLLACRGAYADSETELATALKMFEKQDTMQGQGVLWAYDALRELLRLRTNSQSAIRKSKSAIELARRALELADETARTHYPVVRDYVRAHWLLGAAHRVAGQPEEAERHLHEALERCRRINLVEFEADILIDLARLRRATGAADEAQRLAEEALLITDRSDYVLQGADAHLELARLALTRGDHSAARHHAEEAHRLATCDGPPDYTYKAAYDESAALIASLSPQRD